MKITIAVCEDQEEARENIFARLSKYGNLRGLEWECCAFQTGEELRCTSEEFQILLLDLDLPGVNGVEATEDFLARRARGNLQIIILSGMTEWFKKTFQIRPLRFVTKPIEERELFEALDAALREMDLGKTIQIHLGGQKQEISEKEILYVESKGNYCNFYTKRGKGDCYVTLAALQEELTQGNFFRCHRSYLVNLANIRKMNPKEVQLKSGERIPVSRGKRKELERAISDYYFRQ